MRSRWETWTLVAYEGEHLRVLHEAGAPLRAAISDGRVTYPPAPYAPGGPYRKAVTHRWAAVVINTFPRWGDPHTEEANAAWRSRVVGALRRLLSEEDLLGALFASLELGGVDAGEALLRAVVP